MGDVPSSVGITSWLSQLGQVSNYGTTVTCRCMMPVRLLRMGAVVTATRHKAYNKFILVKYFPNSKHVCGQSSTAADRRAAVRRAMRRRRCCWRPPPAAVN